MFKVFSKLKGVLSLLDRSQKINLFYVFVIYILTIFMEVIGIGMIIPILNIVFNGELNQTYYEYFPNYFKNLDDNELVTSVLIFFILFYLVKTVFGTFALWFHRKFIYKLQENLSVRLLKKYTIEDYQVFLQRNFSDVVRNVAVEAGVFVSGVIHGIVAFSTECMVVSGIAILLILVDPLSSLIIIGIILFLILAYLIIFKKKLRNLGKRRQELEGKVFDQLNKSFQLFREIKIFSKQYQMIDNFKKTIDEKNKIALFEDLINGLPKIYFELIFVIILTGFLSFLLLTNNDIVLIIPVLGLYTAAFFRIFPSFNRIISNINGVIHNYASFDLIQKDLNILTKLKNAPSDVNDFPLVQNYLIKEQKLKKLELNKASFSYIKDDKNFLILNEVDFIINLSEITGLIGESGSGKSTLANIISGFINIDYGQYKINENHKFNKNLLKNLVGYLPQTTNLINDTLLNNICFSDLNNGAYDKKRIDHLIDILELNDLIKSLPEGLSTNIKEQGQLLSGGQRQKIALARALYRDKPILIFDESTSSLDYKSEEKLMDVVNKIKHNRLILFITHNRNLIKYFDKTYELKNKKITSFKS